MLTKNKVTLTWYKIKDGILNIRKKDTTLKLYKKIMYENLKDLKKMEISKTRSDIELIVNRTSFLEPYNENLYNIYLNNIFAVTLGIIDAKIYDCNNKIENRNKWDFDLSLLMIRKQDLLNYKKTVIKDIEQFVSDDNKDLKKILTSLCSYAGIEDLYEYMRTNKSKFNIYGELLNAYIYGYSKPLVENKEAMFLYYKKVISDYSKSRDKNGCRVQKVKYLNNKK